MINRLTKRAFAKQIFVWGNNHNNLAFEPQSARHTDFPQKLPYDFLEDSQRAVSGFSETLFWGKQGVFTSGANKLFANNQLKPTKLESLNDYGVLDADVDRTHALFLASDGSVFQSKGVDGLGRVQLSGPAEKIAAGKDVSLAVVRGEDGAQEVYIWGKTSFDERAIFLDPRSNESTSPQPLKGLNDLLRKQNSSIKKIRLVDTSAVVLLDNGQLITWGNNTNGNLGVPRSELSLADNFVYKASMPLKLAHIDKRAVDFDLSDNVLIVLLEDGTAAFSGMNGTLTLKVLDFVEEQKIRKVGCCHNHYFLVAGDGRIFSNKNFEAEQYVKYFGDLNLYQIDGKYFGGQSIETIGGKYDNFIAVAK